MPLLGAALFTLAACSENETPLEPAGETSVELAATDPGPLPGRIAFSSAREASGSDIYLMNPDGSGVTRLTSFPGNERLPAWSWDNKQITFTRARIDATNQTHADIFVMDADGANGHWVSPTPNPEDLSDPAWSPDGSRILVTGEGGDLKSLDVVTGALSSFKLGGQAVPGRYASFDPTGKKIAFRASGGALGVMNADGTGTIAITRVPVGSAVEYPTFSPDGKQIAFIAVRPASPC
jgi:TolB protein